MRETLSDLDELRTAVSYRNERRVVFNDAMVCIVLGVVAVVSGAIWMSESYLNAVLVAIGLGLIFQSYRTYKSISTSTGPPGGMRIQALALAGLGAWNLFVAIYSASTWDRFLTSTSWKQPFYGLALLSYAAVSLFRYRSIKKLHESVSHEALEVADRMVAMAAYGSLDDPLLLEFETTEPFARERWRAKLSDQVVVFVSLKTEEASVVTPAEVEIRNRGEVLMGDKLKVSVRGGSKLSFHATIDPAMLARYELWKAGRGSSAAA